MKTSRARSGSAILEFGPSLWVLLILIIFPLSDLMAISMQYCCSWYLNHLVAQDLSTSEFSDWSNTVQQVRTRFDATGAQKFARMVDVEHDYTNVPADAGKGTPAFLIATTKVDCQPFLTVPLPMSVPGLNSNMQLCITSTRMWETFNPNDTSQSARQTTSITYKE